MRSYHVRIVVNAPDDQQAFAPRDLFQRLPSHSPKQTIRRSATANFENKDYRLGPLRVDWADFHLMEVPIAPNTSSGKRREQGHASARFTPLRNGSTNLPEGVVHIFRDTQDLPPEELVSKDSVSSSNLKTIVLGVLAVPSWMTPSDFLSFAAPAADGISHIRLIRCSFFCFIPAPRLIATRDSLPNRSFVLVEFPKPEDATEFINAYNGKPFNSLEVIPSQILETNLSLTSAKVRNLQRCQNPVCQDSNRGDIPSSLFALARWDHV